MKRILGVSLVILLLTIGLAGGSFAGTKAGDKEVGVQMSLNHDFNGDGSTATQFSGDVGYFFTDAFEAGVSVGINWAEAGDVDVTSVSGFGIANYHFNTSSNIVPYVGAGAGFEYASYDDGNSDDSNTEFAIEGHVGIKQFVAERTFLNYQVQYHRLVGSDIEDDGRINATIGVGFSF